MYSAHELAELGERLAEDGPARHERTLQEIASAIVDRAPGAAAALGDTSAADVFRQRALVAASLVLLAQPRRHALEPAA